MTALRRILPLALVLVAACDSDDDPVGPQACREVNTTGPGPVPSLPVLGRGCILNRFTGEVWAEGTTAYTTSWGLRGLVRGNAINIWDISSDVPTLIDSIIVPGAGTLGDVQVSDDGALLVVAKEYEPGAIIIYDLADPRAPEEIARYSTPNTEPGVHTAEVARVNGTLYAFLSIDPGETAPARLVIVDLSDPTQPTEVFSQAMGSPFVHDVFVRDGILFTALWNDGLTIWDVGGGGQGGTPANPVQLGNVLTIGGDVHNVWWFHDATGAKRYAFVGEEGPGVAGSSSSGDIHVVDVSDFANPVEVAFFHVDGAGVHNFAVDEAQGLLYAAYYNAGVRVLDVSGDLSDCAAEARVGTRCDLGAMGREVAQAIAGGGTYVWGVKLHGDRLLASDMLNGLWVLGTVDR